LKSLFLHCINLAEIVHECDKSLHYVKIWKSMTW
jgi:hypothetical protein